MGTNKGLTTGLVFVIIEYPQLTLRNSSLFDKNTLLFSTALNQKVVKDIKKPLKENHLDVKIY